MLKRIFILVAILWSVVLADFIEDHSIKGTITRGHRGSIISSALNADSSGAYNGRIIFFGGTDPDIKYCPAIIINFVPATDSLVFWWLFSDSLIQAPAADDSFWIMPFVGYELATLGNVADTVRKSVLKSPYNQIYVDNDGYVVGMPMCDGCRIRWFPTDRNPKDSAWFVDPTLGADSVISVIRYYRTQNSTNVEQFNKR